MKILVLGLDCAAPEILLGEESLHNIRHLMQIGCHGRLQSVTPPITVPAWMCLATSQDPGSLGVYGFRNRDDYSYDGLSLVNSRSIRQLAIWDQLALEGRTASIIGVPPNYPPRRTSGVSVGCFITPDAERNVFTCPADFGQQIQRWCGSYPVDVRGFRTHNKSWLRDEIFRMSRTQFDVLRQVMTTTPWDYLQFVDIGLDRVQHGFWKYHDPQHRKHEPNSPFVDTIRDYYRHLDEEIGRVLQLLDDETIVLVVSDHGAKRLDGGFCVNEWLIREGLLVLHEYPSEVTPFDRLSVDWERTTAWSEGGYYARIFLNLAGREPQGTIPRAEAQSVRDDIQSRLEALADEDGQPMGNRVFRPEEIYRQLNRIPPDLIVYFGDLHWRSVGSVGHGTCYVDENDTGPDDCNHAQYGAFVLAAPGCPLNGEITGAGLLNIAPTLLELAGCDVPPTMQGASLADAACAAGQPVFSVTDEQLVRSRLQGLGYI